MKAKGSQFQQLPMFMSAREIQSSYGPWHREHETVLSEKPPFRKETNEEMYARKLDEFKSEGNADENGQNWTSSYDQVVGGGGPREPVTLGVNTGMIHGGHHRIAAMAHGAPDQPMPVLHAGAKSVIETREELQRGGWKA